MRRLAKPALSIIATCALALACTACSADGDDAPGQDPVTVWIMGDSGANFARLVEPFTSQTGVEVEVVAIPWDGIDERLTTAVASDAGPDLVQIGLSKLRMFADAGALLPLDDEIVGHPGLAPANFADGVAGAATAVDGQIVSVPWISDTRVLFYRSDILSQNGIADPPTTWSELRDQAQTLAGRGSGQYGYYIPQWDSALPVLMTWSNGGDIVDPQGQVDFDTPAFARTVETYAGLYADGSVPTNSDFDQTQGFISGIAPLLISGPYLAKSINDAAPELAGQWSVATVPQGSGSATSVFAGSNMGVWHSTDQKQAALDLLEFLSRPATQLEWYSINGELPTAKAALSDSALTGDPLVRVYSAQLEDARVLPMVPNWDGGVGQDLLTALNSIVLQGADPDRTLADLYARTGSVSAR
ncbi:MAG: extracellular solute-binding protein [Propionibacteriaceae bacterium]|jgi:multiple sugar transport system substrate-binding protein|nr:extracellular solute-binding protein [Propionibacteriaceae bacterium]